MCNETLSKFFRSLALRHRSEPALSDVTYAVLKTVPDLRQDFVQFFYPNLNGAETFRVEREFTLPEGGRPDFVLHSPTWDLIVENKIWDQNYHFNEYQAVDPERKTYRALLANHRVTAVPEACGWSIRRWEELVEELDKKHYGNCSALVSGYLEYVREVCEVGKLVAFGRELLSVHALHLFNHTVKAAIQGASTDRYETSIIDGSGSFYNFGEGWSGFYFRLMDKKTKEEIRVFFGLNYFEDSPFLQVYIDKKGLGERFRRIDANVAPSPEYEIIRGNTNGGCLELRMPVATLERVTEESSFDQQLRSLGDFLACSCQALLYALAPQEAKQQAGTAGNP